MEVEGAEDGTKGKGLQIDTLLDTGALGVDGNYTRHQGGRGYYGGRGNNWNQPQYDPNYNYNDPHPGYNNNYPGQGNQNQGYYGPNTNHGDRGNNNNPNRGGKCPCNDVRIISSLLDNHIEDLLSFTMYL